MTQPIPTYTESNFKRVLERDFPRGTSDEARRMLESYSNESWQGKSLRKGINLPAFVMLDFNQFVLEHRLQSLGSHQLQEF